VNIEQTQKKIKIKEHDKVRKIIEANERGLKSFGTESTKNTINISKSRLSNRKVRRR